MPLVTAIITTHKRAPQVVERAIKSVLAQTHKDLELIVVDDSPSTYELRDMVKQTVQKYAGEYRVSYIPHESCQGACVARNTGFAAAQGEYIAFLDDDDEWCPNKIELQLAPFKDDAVALVYCMYYVVDDTTQTTVSVMQERHSGFVFDELIKWNFIGSTSAPLLRADALRSVGGFDPQQQSAQDFDVWLRLAKEHKVDYVDEELIKYHIHPGDQISKSSLKRIQGQELINEKHKEYLATHKEAYWMRTIKMVPEYAGNKQYGKALTSWLKAVVKKPFEVKGNLEYLYAFFRKAFV